MTETEKKGSSKQRITLVIASALLVIGFINEVTDWGFDYKSKWEAYRDKQELRQINKNAEIISDSTIAKVIREIDPLTAADFADYRDSINTQLRNGKKIAFSYMNAVDSLIQVVNNKNRALIDQRKRIDMLEVELKVAKAQSRDEGLETVMQTLEKLLNDKSQNQKLDSIMVEIKMGNRKKLESIKTGDRAE